MKESVWGFMFITIGVVSIFFICFFQGITNTDEHNYNMLREVTEAAMYDAFDEGEYAYSGNIKINREKFVESFIRRFAKSASLSNTYEVNIYDVSEMPPKVSVEVKSVRSSNVTGEIFTFDITNRLDAILETPY